MASVPSQAGWPPSHRAGGAIPVITGSPFVFAEPRACGNPGSAGQPRRFRGERGSTPAWPDQSAPGRCPAPALSRGRKAKRRAAADQALVAALRKSAVRPPIPPITRPTGSPGPTQRPGSWRSPVSARRKHRIAEAQQQAPPGIVAALQRLEVDPGETVSPLALTTPADKIRGTPGPVIEQHQQVGYCAGRLAASVPPGDATCRPCRRCGCPLPS